MVILWYTGILEIEAYIVWSNQNILVTSLLMSAVFTQGTLVARDWLQPPIIQPT